jgi:hypothetical protein
MTLRNAILVGFGITRVVCVSALKDEARESPFVAAEPSPRTPAQISSRHSRVLPCVVPLPTSDPNRHLGYRPPIAMELHSPRRCGVLTRCLGSLAALQT